MNRNRHQNILVQICFNLIRYIQFLVKRFRTSARLPSYMKNSRFLPIFVSFLADIIKFKGLRVPISKSCWFYYFREFVIEISWHYLVFCESYSFLSRGLRRGLTKSLGWTTQLLYVGILIDTSFFLIIQENRVHANPFNPVKLEHVLVFSRIKRVKCYAGKQYQGQYSLANIQSLRFSLFR